MLGFAKIDLALYTDASTTGLGAAIYQEQDGESKVIAFASRGLLRSESRYPAHKLQFLVLKCAVTEMFSDYLYGNHLIVITDSILVTYILSSAFPLIYRSGKQNQDADGLSRGPHGEIVNDMLSQKEQECIQKFSAKHLDAGKFVIIDCAVVQAVCDKHLIQQECRTPVALVESLSTDQESIPGVFCSRNY